MTLHSFKKEQIILQLNSLLLFLFIIFTPSIIKTGFWGVPEPAVEGIFLFLELIILSKLFQKYNQHNLKNVTKVNKLSAKLRQQENLLIDSLEYLGKINIQMSIVKKVISQVKIPRNENRLDYLIQEILQSISQLSKSKKVTLKLIDLKNEHTLKKISLGKNQTCKLANKISNKKLLRQDFSNKKTEILTSSYDNFSIKSFLFLEKDKNRQLNSDQKTLIKGLVNQCEILFLLFNSKYYRHR